MKECYREDKVESNEYPNGSPNDVKASICAVAVLFHVKGKEVLERCVDHDVFGAVFLLAHLQLLANK